MSLGQPIARLLSERPWILAIAGASVAALLLYEAWRQGEDYGPFLEGAERTAVVERLVNEPGFRPIVNAEVKVETESHGIVVTRVRLPGRLGGRVRTGSDLRVVQRADGSPVFVLASTLDNIGLVRIRGHVFGGVLYAAMGLLALLPVLIVGVSRRLTAGKPAPEAAPVSLLDGDLSALAIESTNDTVILATISALGYTTTGSPKPLPAKEQSWTAFSARAFDALPMARHFNAGVCRLNRWTLVFHDGLAAASLDRRRVAPLQEALGRRRFFAGATLGASGLAGFLAITPRGARMVVATAAVSDDVETLGERVPGEMWDEKAGDFGEEDVFSVALRLGLDFGDPLERNATDFRLLGVRELTGRGGI